MRSVLTLGWLSMSLLACQSVDIEPAPFQRAQPKSSAEIAFVKNLLSDLQAQSIAKNREYCGYIGLNENGGFIASTARKGRKSSCLAKEVDEDFRLLASYHTHGAYSENFESELPSSDDLIADINEGIDGYVATPGGRIWFNDARLGTTALICSAQCITADPDYDAQDIPDIKRRYTLEQLRAFEQ